jgi:UDPglucose 6-dehydrogenase
MKNICIIGSGYVGLVTGVCFAELGNKVICADNDAKKVASLNKGIIPIYEPGLKELLKKNKNRIVFTSDLKNGIRKAEIVFVTVGTPSREDGSADLSSIERVAAEVARNMNGYKVIVEKSTVPVETGEWVKTVIKRNLPKKVLFDVASNPEFLKEGQAINDFLHPDRVVIGVESKRAEKILTELYKPLNTKILVTDIKSAELIKHASNSFLATKISFINSVANVCERVGADVTKVAEGMGADKRIGRAFLNAGPGFGGSCFPKDLSAFYWISHRLGYDFEILKEVLKVNREQRENAVKKIEDILWILKDKTIAVLGLSFKPETDDMREAPAVDIIKIMQSRGARIKAYDPKAMPKAETLLDGVEFCKDLYSACRSADCMVLLTEWEEFRNIDFKRLKKIMKQPIIVDMRNFYDPGKLRKLGYIYKGVGR